ncbi:hypothetical protein [Bacillus thuringiensis]|uniref:hypothetical protein n=1 Tax=Bacillus thuringiensis TaxID=1428 RepID=UPI000BFB9FD4|nr:hypothetical protein [Bacillus thuringiensis]PGT89970.1 hypothetical protein COD17_09480 [Bacillus thuringiensis]
MSRIDTMQVNGVMINGELSSLGGEMSVSQAMQELEQADLLGQVQGGTPIVVDGVLDFEFSNEDKGVK